ncbi:MAG: hypothetical protein LBK95_11055 [Bifidobacteriaceae bacterium]|jgi:hypothetical protein|nr:hypothetical protein [Bifidobacteriaceae bacterium]
MRTTLNIADRTLERARTLATREERGLSDVFNEAAALGLAQMSETLVIRTDPITGLPTFDLGYPTGREDVQLAKDSE